VESASQPDAFPGAEGFGRHAVGGRGGSVIKVTNLNDDGPGSLRAAIRAKGPRTVLFDVAGTIDLERKIIIKEGFLTIAGQSAPGDGITLRNSGLVIRASEVVIRYIRSRPGSDSGIETDAISVGEGENIIIDHCSTSWATDETLTVSPLLTSELRTIDKVTVQWSMITESLNDSIHSKGEHGYGSLVRGNSGSRYSFHHNLWAHHKARMPRPGNYVDATTDPEGPLFDFRNNVFYNWGGAASGYNADTESISRYNFVNNFYQRGPDSKKGLAFDESNSRAGSHFSGNLMNRTLPENPWSLVRFKDGRKSGSDEPFPAAPVQTRSAEQAYEDVLRSAGASKVRDGVDQRVIDHVESGGGRIIDSPEEVGGWPELASARAPADRDNDGMPDTWELRQNLDPDNPADGAIDSDGDGYTHLEDYLNSLVSFPD
jgi:pectate lyase